jgi:hypothetical protein
VVGTPDYMSPEQARGLKVDARSDIYAFGIVVFELFTGELPFRAETPVATILKHISEPPPLDGEIAARIPAPLRAVLARALAKEPEQRYASVREMRAALEEARASDTESAEAQPGAPADVPTMAMNLATVELAAVAVAPTVQLVAAKPTPPSVPLPAPAAAGPGSWRLPALALGAVALLAGVGLFLSGRAAPVPSPSPAPLPARSEPAPALATPAGVAVKLNALPWARLTLRPIGSPVTLPELTEEQRTTPCELRLPEGAYEVELENGGITPQRRERIEVRGGRVNEFVFRMPDFDPARAAARADKGAP